MADLPAPLAEGDLAKTPFAHVLLHIRGKGYSGSLVLWRTDVAEGQPRQDRVRFERGAPVAAALTEPASRLDRGLLPLFARDAGPYAFYEGADLVGTGDRVRAGRVDVLPLIAASLRGSSRDDIAGAIVRRFGDAHLRLSRGFDLDALGLLPEERSTVDLLRAKPMPAAELRKLSPLAPRTVLRLIYFLAITGAIEAWDGKLSGPPRRSQGGPSGSRAESGERSAVRQPAPEMPGPAPSSLSGARRERWEEIRARAIAIEAENYFEMLGVERSAKDTDIKKAYLQLVKQWHPDRLEPELSELRPFVERVFRYLTRANETLGDPAGRRTYLMQVQEGGGTPEKEREVASIVNAAMEFRKVEVLIRRREWQAALDLVEQIVDVAPDEADYLATQAYLMYQIDAGSTDRRPQILAALERAVELAPDNDKVHYYRGIALKRWGSAEQALEHFARAAELNPRNIEALREVRLAAMRGSTPPSAPGGKGKPAKKDAASFFGKLFGGGKKK